MQLLLSFFTLWPIDISQAGTALRVAPRNAEVALRCPILAAHMASSHWSWRDPTTRGLSTIIRTNPEASFFRRLMAEHLALDRESPERAAFLAVHGQLKELLDQYGSDVISPPMPLEASAEATRLQAKAQALFDAHGTGWVPRIPGVNQFLIRGGIVEGASIGRLVLGRTPEQLDQFLRDLPLSISHLELQDPTPSQLTALAAAPNFARIRTVKIHGSTVPPAEVLRSLHGPANKLRDVDMSDVFTLPEDVDALADFQDKGVVDIGNLGAARITELLQTSSSPILRRSVWRHLVNYGSAATKQAAAALLRPSDWEFLLRDPQFLSLASETFAFGVQCFERLPPGNAALRARYIDTVVRYSTPEDLVAALQDARDSWTSAAAKQFTKELLNSTVLEERRFAAVRAMKQVVEGLGAGGRLRDAQARWYENGKGSEEEKRALLVRASTAVGTSSWAQSVFQNAAPGSKERRWAMEDTMFFVFEANKGDPSPDPFVSRLKNNYSSTATFLPSGASLQLYEIPTVRAEDLEMKLNTWAEKTGHRYRYRARPSFGGNVSTIYRERLPDPRS